jgi:hypothetical protein
MADQSASEPGNARAAASYVATMSADLAVIAREHGLDTLSYLLEMARLEAETVSQHNSGPNDRR